MASADFDSIYMLRIQHNKWIDKTPISQPSIFTVKLLGYRIMSSLTRPPPLIVLIATQCHHVIHHRGGRHIAPIPRPMSQRPSPSPWAPPVPVSALTA